MILCKEKEIKKSTRAMGDRLETRDQYRMTDDQYEVLKSSSCLQAQIMLLLFKPGFPLHFQQPWIEAVLMLPFPLFLCRKVEAVALHFGLLTVQNEEERGQELRKGKHPALQPSVKYTKHIPKS